MFLSYDTRPGFTVYFCDALLPFTKLLIPDFKIGMGFLTTGTLKGIDRPFGGRVESSLIRSVLVNWRLGYIFYFILKSLHHKINKKPSDAA